MLNQTSDSIVDFEYNINLNKVLNKLGKRGSSLVGSGDCSPIKSKMSKNVNDSQSYNRWADETELHKNLLKSNSFSELEDEDENGSTTQNQISNSSGKNKKNPKDKEKIPKIPPINLIKVKYEKAVEILKTENIKDYSVKLTTLGCRISLNSQTNFILLKSKLRELKVEFFTYEVPEDKPVKLVLSGLPLVDTSKLETCLKDKGVSGIQEIKVMTVRKFKFETEHLYLIHFAKSEFDMTYIRQIKSLENLIVHWDYYNKRMGPTQCRRCQMFGHGTKNCNIEPRCVVCGDKHDTKQCPHPKPDFKNGQPTPDYVRCINCNESHQANYQGCKKLKEYIEIKNRMNDRNAGRKTKQNYSYSEGNFPAINGNQRILRGNQNSQNFEKISYSNVLTQNNQNSNNQSLFSFEEITMLVQEVVDKLGQCETRRDQFNVITSLAIKYVYGHGK